MTTRARITRETLPVYLFLLRSCALSAALQFEDYKLEDAALEGNDFYVYLQLSKLSSVERKKPLTFTFTHHLQVQAAEGVVDVRRPIDLQEMVEWYEAIMALWISDTTYKNMPYRELFQAIKK